MAVVDNLFSSSTTDSLSANQGKLLNVRVLSVEALLDSLNTRVTTLEENSSGGGSSNTGCTLNLWS